MTEANQAQSNAANGEAALHPRVIAAQHNNLIDVKEVNYGFRKQKDEATGVEKKRANIELKLHVPSVEGIVAILEKGGKELEFLQDVVAQAIIDQARDVLNSDESLTADNFPYDAVTWEAIANQPETERRGRGIAKEVWEDFAKDYLEVMPSASGKTADNIKKQVQLIMAKFSPLRHHEKRDTILPGFREMLTIYASVSPEAERYAACIEYLNKKIDQFLTQEQESNIESALGF